MATQDVKVWTGTEWKSLKGEPGPQEVSSDSGNLTKLGSDNKVFTEVAVGDVQGLGTIATKAEGDYLPITGGTLDSGFGSTRLTIAGGPAAGASAICTLSSDGNPRLELSSTKHFTAYTLVGGDIFAFRMTTPQGSGVPFAIDGSGYFQCNHRGLQPTGAVGGNQHFNTGRNGTVVSGFYENGVTPNDSLGSLTVIARTANGPPIPGSNGYLTAVNVLGDFADGHLVASFAGFQISGPKSGTLSGSMANVAFFAPRSSLFGFQKNTGLLVDWDEDTSPAIDLGLPFPLDRPNYAIRCEGTARVLFNGLVEIGSGQLKFPATAKPSADANTLDDYEEGSWVPALTASTTPPTVGYSVQSGTYVKVGGMVHVWGRLFLNSLTDAGAGRLSITGLPFPIKAGTFGTGSVGSISAWTTDFPAGLAVSDGSPNSASIIKNTPGTNATQGVLTATALTATSLITFHIAYCTE